MSFNVHVRRLLRSDVSPVHRSNNPELRAALEGLPDYGKALAALTTAADLERPGVRQFDYTDAGRRLAAAVKAGEPVPPPQLVDELAQHEAEQRANESIGHVIEAAQHLLVGELDGAVDVTKVCATLTRRVEEVVAQARALKAVPASADEAIAADAVDAWRALSGIATAYGAIREAQAEVWAAYSTRGVRLEGRVLTRPSVTALAAVAWLRNPQDVVDLDDRPQVGEVGFSTHHVWPQDFNTADSVWWFRDHPEAQPWCPSPDQYEQARQQLQAELQADRRANESPEVRKARRDAERKRQRDLHLAKMSSGRGY